MKHRPWIFPAMGLFLLLLIVLIGVFGGAEVVGEEAMDPRGFWAFRRFLEETGFQVKGGRYGFSTSEEKSLYLVLEGEQFTLEQGKDFQQWAELHPDTRIILSGIPQDEGFLKYYHFDLEILHGIPGLVDGERDSIQSEAREYQTVVPQEGLIPLVTLEEGNLLIFSLEDFKGQLWIIADPDLIRNRIFLENDHMLLLYRLLEGSQDWSIYFLKDLANRPYLGMQIFTRGPMGFLFLHLTWLALLFAWYKAVRVGTADIRKDRSRREMREHFQAVGRLYSQAEPWQLLGRIERRFFLSRLTRFFPQEKGKEPQWKERLSAYSQPGVIQRAFGETETLSQLRKTVRKQGIILKDIKNKVRGQ